VGQRGKQTESTRATARTTDVSCRTEREARSGICPFSPRRLSPSRPFCPFGYAPSSLSPTSLLSRPDATPTRTALLLFVSVCCPSNPMQLTLPVHLARPSLSRSCTRLPPFFRYLSHSFFSHYCPVLPPCCLPPSLTVFLPSMKMIYSTEYYTQHCRITPLALSPLPRVVTNWGYDYQLLSLLPVPCQQSPRSSLVPSTLAAPSQFCHLSFPLRRSVRKAEWRGIALGSPFLSSFLPFHVQPFPLCILRTPFSSPQTLLPIFLSFLFLSFVFLGHSLFVTPVRSPSILLDLFS